MLVKIKLYAFMIVMTIEMHMITIMIQMITIMMKLTPFARFDLLAPRGCRSRRDKAARIAIRATAGASRAMGRAGGAVVRPTGGAAVRLTGGAAAGRAAALPLRLSESSEEDDSVWDV